MTPTDEFCPTFLAPPLVETIIGVQFTPLHRLRSGHYGWFWRDCLVSEGWETVDDESLIPAYAERFDDIRLRLTRPSAGALPTSAIRMKVRNAARTRSVQFQPDKLYFTWNREDPEAPRYSKAREEFAALFEKLRAFTEKADLGAIEPNLWDVSYINQIPAGNLWTEPCDWHRVFPTFFPTTNPGTEGHRFATYDGNWHFEIEPKLGRVHVNVAKMVREGAIAPVQFLKLTARGEVGEPPKPDWLSGLDLGHESCVKMFYAVTSPEAHKEWGLQS